MGPSTTSKKPFEIEEMEVKIDKVLEAEPLPRTSSIISATRSTTSTISTILSARSPALQRVLDIVKKVAKSNTTVLITGERGTGKEQSPARSTTTRCAQTGFVKVNCAALPENLLESELFGHEKGAFTGADKQRIGRFEQADGGTLFLDEIGEMSPQHAGQDPARPPGARFERLGGTDAAGRRPGHRGHEPRPAVDGLAARHGLRYVKMRADVLLNTARHAPGDIEPSEALRSARPFPYCPHC